MRDRTLIKGKTAEITRRYLGEKTNEEFAQELGIEASRQMIWNWTQGLQSPSALTLLWVVSSPTSTAEARAWAEECLNVIKDAYGYPSHNSIIPGKS